MSDEARTVESRGAFPPGDGRTPRLVHRQPMV